MKLPIISALFIAAFTLVQSTAAAQKAVVIRGVGGNSCAQYSQAYEKYRPFAGQSTMPLAALEAYGPYESWIYGYLYGVDATNEKPQDFERFAMQRWVYNWCEQNTLDLVANAALAFYRTIGGPVPGTRP